MKLDDVPTKEDEAFIYIERYVNENSSTQIGEPLWSCGYASGTAIL